MEQVNQQEPLRKSTVKRVIENTFNVVRSHMTYIETYGVFGEVLSGETFLEQIREVDGSMKRVADYFVDGGDADGLPMEKLDMTREYVQYMLRIIDGDNIDAAYIAALFRIKTNINTALKRAGIEVKNAPATEVKKEKKQTAAEQARKAYSTLTERDKQAFERAIEKGWMSRGDDDTFVWTYGGDKCIACLAYFIMAIHGEERIPMATYKKLFPAAAEKITDAIKGQRRKKESRLRQPWETEIEEVATD